MMKEIEAEDSWSYKRLTLKEESKVKSDHIRWFSAPDFL